MSQRNKNNSIVFLTTLSVYLGLVLVGAPTVLAQAALPSRLEVKEKIERKDDLDKKPDESADEKIQSLKFGNQVILDYVEVVKILLEASRQANPNGFSFASETKSDSVGNLQIKRAFFTKLDNRELDSRQIFHKINSELNKLFKFFPAQTSYDESNITVSFKLSREGFTTESKFLQKDAFDTQELLSVYNASLEYLRRETFDKPQILILKHTEILAENKHFIIVTRLPRGSLDVLLAKDAQ